MAYFRRRRRYPFRRRRRSIGRRRTFRRRRGGAMRVVSRRRVGHSSTYLSNKIYTRLRFFATCNTGTAIAGNYVLDKVRVNGMNGLLSIATGSWLYAGNDEPRGRDQVATIYSRYYVAGIKVTVKIINAASIPVIFGVAIREDSVTPTNGVQDYCEEPFVKKTVVSALSDNVRTITMNVNPSKFLGIPSPLSEDTITTAFAFNPTRSVFAHIFTGPLEGTTDTIGSDKIYYEMNIDFMVVCLDRKPIGAS